MYAISCIITKILVYLGVKMEWCNDGDVLVVGGFVRLPNLECNNELRFYTRDGFLRYNLRIPQQVISLNAIFISFGSSYMLLQWS